MGFVVGNLPSTQVAEYCIRVGIRTLVVEDGESDICEGMLNIATSELLKQHLCRLTTIVMAPVFPMPAEYTGHF